MHLLLVFFAQSNLVDVHPLEVEVFQQFAFGSAAYHSLVLEVAAKESIQHKACHWQ